MVDSIGMGSGLRFSINLVPLAIGGVGGSGTRLVASIIEELGYYLGHDLNGANDNLFFTLLFKRKEVLQEEAPTIDYLVSLLISSLRGNYVLSSSDIRLIRSLGDTDRSLGDKKWWVKRAEKAIRKPANPRRDLIAWKEPNSHIILQHLMQHESQIKYLHVVRDGLDMAFSANQQQLVLWGEYFLNRPISIGPKDSLDYWNAAHRKVLALQAQFPDRITTVSYDRLCEYQPNALQKIYDFAGIAIPVEQQETIKALIKPPSTLGRGTAQKNKQFDPLAISEYENIMELCVKG